MFFSELVTVKTLTRTSTVAALKVPYLGLISTQIVKHIGNRCTTTATPRVCVDPSGETDLALGANDGALADAAGGKDDDR